MSFRYSRILAGALLASLACSAHAQWWHPTNPSMPGNISAPKVVYTRDHVGAAKMAVNAFVFNDDWTKLERMYAEFLEAKLRTTDGTDMVEAIQTHFAEGFAAWDEKMAARVLKSWETKLPQSRLRPIIVPLMHQAQAWKARGGDYGSSVPNEAMQIFRDKLRLAAASLKESEAEGQQSPIWWWVSLIVAGSSGAPSMEFDRMFEQAVQRFPTYKPLYYTRMNYLLPEWGGNFAAVDRFIDTAVARTASVEGEAMYAWLYLDIARKTHRDFEGTAVSWPRMKRAFEDMVARYPDNWNRNVFATFACRARDKETTGRLLRELGDKASLGAWSQGITTDGCRRFAYTST